MPVKKDSIQKDTPKKKGKPPINPPDDVQAIQNKIDNYFESLIQVDADGETVREEPTYCGLAIALDYASRQSLWENSKSGSPISLPIKKAMLKIEESYEKGLRFQACTGSIFALKNKGWTDKSELELSGLLETASLTPDERKARIAELEKKRSGK